MSSLITRARGEGRGVPYTLAEDQIIVNTYNDDNKTVTDVKNALAVAGFTRTNHSIRYRLAKLEKFDSMEALEAFHAEKAAKAESSDSE